ncbi:MAG: hypothetical protein A2504_17625 [Bdellovibrionales bacterium RIFOXYD12_FULL_39_22]|nr:MAG: hypothetical protein A2385_15325 [Bdellovibrionales bacterium RIFOXYB1_FULL_39_21]OFZ40620.1 MAG: hypothetical protein A2485_03440 [Bdellovibrionales bacterium RIFOXYC12_FULL_39_17]OFZ50432.1 MAG: hypothetical protein A2404_02625 [Bdellovibrionales bacterium RIFOXYC1_FULL_39_130]OFZ75283.1 MAG: hypothetical protein A2451_12865 [Bdellovibrionales bacterium RIFOXYC2_FULL_39_8]OFZ77691.1 MAG: hypothetical protein A2560_04995 [Bdellovibrionales bacterium RIFOXYD1_FULL_39_84]OFZ91725.1 MAG:
MSSKKVSFGSLAPKKPERLNITSLMDILTIILIFLLVNYSDVVEEVPLPDYIILPKVQIKSVGKAITGITLIVGKDRWAFDKGETIAFNSFASQREEVMKRAAQGLERIKQEYEKDGKAIELMILADKDVPYKMIDSVVLTAAGVGITAINFVSMRQDI